MARLSGLQREVLSLYRKCLREIRKKPSVSFLFSLHDELVSKAFFGLIESIL